MPGIYTGQIAWRPVGDIGDCQALEGKARVGIQWLFEQIQQCGASQAYGTRSQRWVVDGSVITAWVVQTPLGQRSAWCEIYVPGSSKPPVLIQFEFLEDYVCGVVTNKEINSSTTNSVATIKRLVETTEGTRRVPQNRAEAKLAVPLPPQFATMDDQKAQSAGKVLSQYQRIRAGNYTGYMRQLVQLLLGIGVAQELTFEESLVTDSMIPAPQTNADASGASLQPRYPATTVVTYDYRFFRSHGVTWSTDGVCYVIQIGMGGVFAKPLQVHPTSLTQGGRERYQRLYPELFVPDLSEKGLFDLFGGFPVEGGFPGAGDLTKYVNAGDVVRLCSQAQLGEFYSKSPYSNAIGWAFAPTEKIAVNTCWNMVGEVKKGYLYNVSWEIGEWKEPDWTDANRNLAAIFPVTDAYQTRKIRRLSSEQVTQVELLLASKPETPDEEWTKNFYQAFDDIEVEPVVEGQAVLRLQQSGWLFHPAKFAATGTYCNGPTGHPQFKTPTEEIGFNESFNFNGYWSWTKGPKGGCDTPVWACWVKDQLFVVYYYWRENPTRIEPAVDTRGECDYVGTWVTSIPETRTVQGNFYSNVFDLRREVCTAGSSVTTTSAKWAGTEDFFRFCYIFEMQCTIIRNVFTISKTNTKTNGRAAWSSGLAVPFGDRSIIYGATQFATVNNSEVTIYGKPKSVGNTGYTRYGEVSDFVCHWRNTCGYGYGRHAVSTGDPHVMYELVPMSVTESCFSSFGPPEFPYYKPWGAGPEGLGGGCIFSLSFNSTVQHDVEEVSNVVAPYSTVEWEVRIYGDTVLHNTPVTKGMSSGPNSEELHVGITDWWFKTSPTACMPPQYCAIHVTLNRWGNDIISAETDFDYMGAMGYGLPAEMQAGSQSVYCGYVSDEVFDYG